MSREEVMDEVWANLTEREATGGYQRQVFDPIEEVTVIPADQAPVYRPREREEERSAGAAEIPKLKRAVTADDLHEQRIAALEDALKAAHDFLTLPRTGAKAWASDLRYAEAITVHIEDAADAVTSALRLIDIQESR